MTGDARRDELLEFLRSIQRPDRPLNDVSDDTHLVDAGFIDSLAVLQVITWLETRHAIDFSTGVADPAELTSVGAILRVIERG